MYAEIEDIKKLREHEKDCFGILFGECNICILVKEANIKLAQAKSELLKVLT